MIALVLGLIIIGGAGTIFLSNQQAYRTNDGLSYIQESSRSAFELLAREARGAGGSACSHFERVANVVNEDPNSPRPWDSASMGIQGYDGSMASDGADFGTGIGDRVSGTHAVRFQGMDASGLSVRDHQTTSAQLFTNGPNDFKPGEILIVCDLEQASIFQVTGPNNPGSQNEVVVHNTGSSVSPGNCSKGLGYPTVCTTNGTAKEYGENSVIARFNDNLWFIGHNGRTDEGGRSLYRVDTYGNTQEMVAGVTNLQVTYKRRNQGDWENASDLSGADWAEVEAIEVTLTMNSATTRISTNNANDGRLERQLTHVIALRNRLP
nr:prepilin-type cleavage/methylation domain-containing protein [Ectothiorhodospira variabilis]